MWTRNPHPRRLEKAPAAGHSFAPLRTSSLPQAAEGKDQKQSAYHVNFNPN
jgi:hypothetical protein